MEVRTSQHISISEATRLGISGLVAEVVASDVVLERHGEPVAMLLSMDRVTALEDARADLCDLALVLARMATDSGERISFDEILGAFGLTREELASLPDEN